MIATNPEIPPIADPHSTAPLPRAMVRPSRPVVLGPRTWKTAARVVAHLCSVAVVLWLGVFFLRIVCRRNFQFFPFNIGSFLLLLFGVVCPLVAVIGCVDAWRIWKRGEETPFQTRPAPDVKVLL